MEPKPLRPWSGRWGTGVRWQTRTTRHLRAQINSRPCVIMGAHYNAANEFPVSGEGRLFNRGVHHRDGRPGQLNRGQTSWDAILLQHHMTTTRCEKPSDLSATEVPSFSLEGRSIVPSDASLSMVGCARLRPSDKPVTVAIIFVVRVTASNHFDGTRFESCGSVMTASVSWMDVFIHALQMCESSGVICVLMNALACFITGGGTSA